ncbi:MAG: cytochrome c [Myxococcaceae bacterium]|nr:cytochrome c [Myxococcaceae bacterium]
MWVASQRRMSVSRFVFSSAAVLFTACFEKPIKPQPEDIDFGHGTAAAAVMPPELPKPAQDAPPPGSSASVAIPKFEVSTDADAVAQGKDLFSAKGCVGCHKVGGGKLVGPDLKGVTARRDQEWLARMILRPDVMVKEDETAKKLLAEHMVPMPNQNVDAQKELPLLLAFLKSNEK